jgi:hypothetical protein
MEQIYALFILRPFQVNKFKTSLQEESLYLLECLYHIDLKAYFVDLSWTVLNLLMKLIAECSEKS